jgi:hypothetical protein
MIILTSNSMLNFADTFDNTKQASSAGKCLTHVPEIRVIISKRGSIIMRDL